jgi:predicted enzyme involved in methoxymalonyl-ACP biosynthesis
MSDDLTAAGVDGICPSYDEHYDTVKEVVADPYGAWDAIQKQANRIERLEAELIAAEQRGYANAMEAERKLHEERIEELEAKLAKAVELIALCRKMQTQVAHPKDPLMVLIDTTLAELEGNTDA